MAGITDFLRREGWRVNEVSKNCPEDFPLHMGVMFLIGQQMEQASAGESPGAKEVAAASRGGGEVKGQATQYCIIWLDPNNRVQVEPISMKGNRIEVSFGGRDYKLAAEAEHARGRWCLKGIVTKKKNGKEKTQLSPSTGYTTTGTWGAEGNGGGGGVVWPEPVAAACAEVTSEAKEAVHAASAGIKNKLGVD
jgi:hypothetical protein